MKPKPSQERVPYRRGPQEEAALHKLARMRSRFVPVFSSDNQWLRFSVRLLAELWRLAGKRTQPFYVGESEHEHARVTSELQLLSAPPSELTSRSTGEARLRQTESIVLERLREELGHPSRSSALRHALLSCHRVCDALRDGSRLWVEQTGRRHELHDLLAIAATMEQDAQEPLVTPAYVEPAPRKRMASAEHERPRPAILISEDPESVSIEEQQACFGDRPVTHYTPKQLRDALQSDALAIVLGANELNEGMIVVQQADKPDHARLFQPRPRDTSSPAVLGNATRSPAGGDGTAVLLVGMRTRGNRRR